MLAIASRPPALLAALLVACTTSGEFPPGDPAAPVADEPAPEPATPAPAIPFAPPPPTPTAPLRLHPATTTAELFGLTGDDSGLLLAVGVLGTILRSEDHGQSWRELAAPTHQNLRAAWRSPAGTLFAAGDAGTIVRSRDRGLTWEALRSGTTVDLEHLAGNTLEVVVAGQAGTILRTRDDGDSWTAVAMPTIPATDPARRAPLHLRRRDDPPPIPSDDDVLRGMFSPTENIVGVGTARPGDLWIALRKLVWQRPDEHGDWRVIARASDTRDSFGELWVDATHWAVAGRTSKRERPRYFVGLGVAGNPGHVWNWTDVDSRLIGVPKIVGAARPGALPILYLAGMGYAVHWSEDGQSWDGSEQSAIMQSPYPLAKNALWVAPDGTLFAAGTAGAVMRSRDRARTWTAINGAEREPLFGGALGRDGSILTAVAFAVLRGRGDRWQLLSPGSQLPTGAGKQDDTSRGLVRCCTDVWVAPDGTILAAGDGLIWRSTDDGRSWKKAHDDDPRWDCCDTLWGDERGVFSVGGGTVLESTDHGKTWTRHAIASLLTADDRDRRDISGSGDHLLVTGGAGLLLHSSDRGKTWTRRTSPTREPLYSTFIMTTTTGLLALAVGEHGTLLRSTDAIHWQQIAVPTTMRLQGAYGDASRGELYLAGERGLLRSRDEGLTWTLDPAVQQGLRSIFGDGRGQVLAAGESGLVLRLP